MPLTVGSTLRERIAQHLTSLIAANLKVPGDSLPTEIELARQFRTTRTTVGRAIGTLRERGLVVRRRGRGTFVTERAPRLLRQEAGSSGRSARSQTLQAVRVVAFANLWVGDHRYTQYDAAQIEAAFEERLAQRRPGSTVTLVNTAPDRELGPQHLDAVVSMCPDAVLVLDNGYERDPLAASLARWRRQGVLAICAGTTEPLPGVDKVACDNRAIGRLAAQYLRRLGHDDLAFAAPADELPWIRQRLAGFVEELACCGGPPPLVWREGFGASSAVVQATGLEVGRQLLRERSYTALFAVSDLFAAGLLRAAVELGVRVPEDVSIISVDNHCDARPLNLTTIPQPTFEIGQQAADLLLEKVADPRRRERIDQLFVSGRVIARKSTAPRPQPLSVTPPGDPRCE